MTEKKIATSMEILIKVADFESVRITKYGEAKIEYDSDEDRIRQEDKLQEETTEDMLRSLKELPNKFGKTPEKLIIDMGERISKKIPAWLEEGADPNIANVAKKDHEKLDAKAAVENERRQEKDVANAKAIAETLGETEEKPQEKVPENDENLFDDEDLF